MQMYAGHKRLFRVPFDSVAGGRADTFAVVAVAQPM
jgi:hypothetical protein